MAALCMMAMQKDVKIYQHRHAVEVVYSYMCGCRATTVVDATNARLYHTSKEQFLSIFVKLLLLDDSTCIICPLQLLKGERQSGLTHKA